MKRMFRSLTRKFANLDRITALFTKAVRELQQLQEANRSAILDNDEVMVKLLQENTQLQIEAAKAARFQKNLEALLGT